MDRLRTLFSLVGTGEVFADVGCDHGYLAEMVLKSGNYKRVIISDISKSSLQKAVDLLKPYGDRVTAVVSDGLESFTELPDEVAIAGMGGEEIVKILSSAMSLPKKLVLAPQKNSVKVRKLLFDLGYKILKDFTIKDKGKFYDIISAVEADIEPKEYTNLEYIYGRDNLNERPDDFIEKLTLDEKLYEGVVQTKTASETAKSVAMQKLKEIREILK
ncbi:MAG: SAM-dependent methyltransferase [Clostridia bacterium]|nr:SAM-dependent methyltransferase [Clostridia bacterium]